MSFDRFEFKDEKLYCKDCGAEVKRGIINVSEHWVGCGGKVFYNSLMEIAELKNGKITMEDIDEIKKNNQY